MFGLKVPEISVKELVDRMNNSDELVLIDIRMEQEWMQTGIIEGANLITDQYLVQALDAGKLQQQIKGKELVIICRSGSRSKRMTDYLLNQRNDIDSHMIWNMTGGILEWKRNGLPVVVPEINH